MEGQCSASALMSQVKCITMFLCAGDCVVTCILTSRTMLHQRFELGGEPCMMWPEFYQSPKSVFLQSLLLLTCPMVYHLKSDDFTLLFISSQESSTY